MLPKTAALLFIFLQAFGRQPYTQKISIYYVKSDFEFHWFYMQRNYSNTLNGAKFKEYEIKIS